MHPQLLADTGRSCGYAPGRAHARTGNRMVIAAHLGSGDDAGIAFTCFIEAYADLNDRDDEPRVTLPPVARGCAAPWRERKTCTR